MKKSELKEIIKTAMLAEADDSKKGNSEEQKRMEGAIRDDRDHIKNLEKDIKDNEDKLSKLKKDKPEDVIKEELVDFEGNDMYPEIKGDMKRYYKMDVPMNVIKDWADDYFSDRYDDKDDYEFETSAREDFLDHLEDKFVSGDSKPKWWNLTEAEEVDVEDNEEVNVDIEDEVNIDDESSESEIEVDSELAGEDSDVAAILGLLTKAQSEAKSLGDEKLMDQIGNTITYYTRQHVVAEEEGMDPERFQGSGGDEVDSDSIVNVTKDNPAEDAEVGFALDESTSRFKKLAGII